MYKSFIFLQTDEAIDEDIEALLYAQIYYGKSDYVEATQPVESQSDLSPPEGHQNDLDSVEGHSINGEKNSKK